MVNDCNANNICITCKVVCKPQCTKIYTSRQLRFLSIVHGREFLLLKYMLLFFVSDDLFTTGYITFSSDLVFGNSKRNLNLKVSTFKILNVRHVYCISWS